MSGIGEIIYKILEKIRSWFTLEGDEDQPVRVTMDKKTNKIEFLETEIENKKDAIDTCDANYVDDTYDVDNIKVYSDKITILPKIEENKSEDCNCTCENELDECKCEENKLVTESIEDIDNSVQVVEEQIEEQQIETQVTNSELDMEDGINVEVIEKLTIDVINIDDNEGESSDYGISDPEDYRDKVTIEVPKIHTSTSKELTIDVSNIDDNEGELSDNYVSELSDNNVSALEDNYECELDDNQFYVSDDTESNLCYSSSACSDYDGDKEDNANSQSHQIMRLDNQEENINSDKE